MMFESLRTELKAIQQWDARFLDQLPTETERQAVEIRWFRRFEIIAKLANLAARN
jgi:hypothetical protein